MAFFPCALSLDGRSVVVVGGSTVAARKVRSLLRACAKVTVIAPALGEELHALAARGQISWRERPFARGDLNGAALAVAATDDPHTNATVAKEAAERGIFCNDAADRRKSTLRNPAVHRLGEITFTVDCNGAAPSFSMRLRDEIASHFDERYAFAARTLARLRQVVKGEVPSEDRVRVLRKLAALPIEQLARVEPDEDGILLAKIRKSR